MLIVCKPDLTEAEFTRLEGKLAELHHPLRWGRRSGRLVVLLERVRADQPELKPVIDDEAVEHVLHDPSEREIARIFSRRDLLDLSLASTGLLAAAAVLGPLAVYLTAPASERTAGGDILVGEADSIPINGARSRVIEGEEYLVVRRGEKQFHALSATCTHSEVCLVAWDPERRQLVCPCHRGVFDLNGNVVSGPPPRPLRRRDVVVRDGGVYVRQQ